MRQLKIEQQITLRESASFSIYLHEISILPLLTIDEEVELSNRIKEGDEVALKKFVEGNLRFVVSVAKRYQGMGRLEDLVNVGNLGLIIAAKRFDSSRGFKFISFGVWWIRQSILKYLSDNSKVIRLSGSRINMINKIKRANSALEQVLHRNPTSKEISEELMKKDIKINSLEIDNSLLSDTPVSSLDMKLGDDSDSTLADVILSKDSNNAEEKIQHQDFQKTIKNLFDSRLSNREQNIVVEFFGLFGTKSKSLDEIGEALELTKERVRQIKEKAIRKLRHRSNFLKYA